MLAAGKIQKDTDDGGKGGGVSKRLWWVQKREIIDVVQAVGADEEETSEGGK